MRGHLHTLSSPPFQHWILRFYEIDVQSSTLKQWHDEVASTREAPLRCTAIYLVDSATIEMPPPKTTFAARLVLTLCKGTGEQTTISFAHEDTSGLYVLQAAILRLAYTVPATRAALAQSSALRLAAQGPTIQGWLLKRRELMAGWRRRLFVLCLCAACMHARHSAYACDRAHTTHTQALLCAVARGRRRRGVPRILH